MADSTNAKQVFLHIGAHKTASTMISALLKRAQPDIKKRGIKLVFRETLLEAPLFNHLNKVIHKKLPLDAPLSDEAVQNKERLLSGHGDKVLMTSEDMFKRLHPREFYENIGLGLQMLRREMAGHRIHVIFYVREQASYLESVYTQYVHIGRLLSFDEFIEGQIPQHLSWRRVCDEILAALGPGSLTVRPFESIRDLRGERFFQQFLEMLGVVDASAIPLDQEALSGRAANRSFSDVAMQMARIAAPVVSPEDMKTLRRFLQIHFSTEHYPRAKLLSDAQRAEMKSLYATDNAQLFATHMPDYDPARYGYV